MKKSDEIDLKNKADLSIKHAKKRGEIRKVEKPIISSFIHADDLTIHVSASQKLPENDLMLGNEIFAGNLFAPISNTIVNDQQLWSFFNHSEPTIEKQIEKMRNDMHEELASERKYSRELESRIVSLTETMTRQIHENNKLKSQLKDVKEELNDVLEKYGPAILFVKDYIKQMRKEKEELQNFRFDQ